MVSIGPPPGRSQGGPAPRDTKWPLQGREGSERSERGGSGLPPHRGGGLLYALAGAITFSGKAIIVKLAYGYGTDAVTLIMLRMAFALPFFVLLAWWAGRTARPLERRDWLTVIALGFTGYYLSSMLDFLGLQYVSASLERLILYLNPTIVLLLGWAIFGRRVSARRIGAMAVSYLGVALVFATEVRFQGRNTALGAALVLGSATTYALYLIYSGEAVKRIGALRLTGLATSIACVLCIVQYLVLRAPSELAQVPAAVVWLSIVNAVACTVVPVLLVMLAIERIGPASTAQAGMIGPLSTVALSAWLLGERITPVIVAGTALVLAGVALVARVKDDASAASRR
jgi:drug/metabolite transporter (DMT)-like permease